MKKRQFNEHKVGKLLNEAEAGAPVQEVCREHGISPSTFYRWKAVGNGCNSGRSLSR